MKAKAYLDNGVILNFDVGDPPPKRIRIPTAGDKLPSPPEGPEAPSFPQIKCKLAGVHDGTAICVGD